jgi:hypothetical protein
VDTVASLFGLCSGLRQGLGDGHPCVCGQRERIDNGKVTAKAVAREHCGREADFSTALLARTRAASVEMTVPEISEKKDTGDGQ